MSRIKLSVLALLLCLGGASPAFADLTAFVGTTTTPENRTAKGVALGINLFVIGFEFEFASTSEKPEVAAPSLRTGSGNLLVQTPVPILGLQPYFTSGGGMYRERLGDASETHFAFNTGGGVKVSLLGPIRARLDYRVFRLRGEPLHSTVHRLYAGANLAF
jgi:opacity protein-like surface antigen